MTFYTTIFRKSWSITKRHAVLWFFGLFVLFWGGKGMEFEQFFTNARLLSVKKSPFSPFQPDFWSQQTVQQFCDYVVSDWRWAALLAIALVLAVFVFVVIMVSQVGLVDAYGRYGEKPTAPEYSFADAWNTARPLIGRVAAINILIKVLSYGLVALASIPLFVYGLHRGAMATFFLLILLTPVALVLSLCAKYAVAYMVLNGERAGSALQNGWKLFRANIGVSLEMAFMMFLIYFLVNVAALVLAFFLSIPLYFVIQLFSLGGDVNWAPGFYYDFTRYAVLGTMLLSTMLFSAWHFGNWTLLFLQLTKGVRRSKIHRVFISKGE